MSLIFGGIIAASLACNRLLLIHGLKSMLMRYPADVIVGYAAFFILIRVWLFYVHNRFDIGTQVVALPQRGILRNTGKKRDSWLEYLNIDPGLGDDWGCLILLLIVGFLFFLIGGFFLIFDAPALLTEAAGSFFLAGSLAKPMQAIDAPEWTGSIFRRTWGRFAFALVLAILMAIFAHRICPGAHTIIEVFRGCHN